MKPRRPLDPDVTLFDLVSAFEDGNATAAEGHFEKLIRWLDGGGHFPDLRQGINKADKRNPSLVVYNPPDSIDGALMSERVHQIRYRHVENDQDYFHDFDAGVSMIALDGGDILLKSDKVLWEDFEL